MFRISLLILLALATGLELRAQIYWLPMDELSLLRQERASLGTQPAVHSSAKPILRSNADVSGIPGLNPDTSKYYSLITEKLFGSHLLELKKPGLELYADVMFDFSFGDELEDEILGSENSLYTNTRGFSIQGVVGNAVYFYTDFLENQARFPAYLTQFVDSTEVVPAMGRVKTFGDGGFDFSMANGYIGFSPSDWLHISAGHFRQFVGQGHRSILLSDNAFNYPFASYTVNFFEGKIQNRYTIALLKDLERLPSGDAPESLFERKASSWNYLSYKPWQNLEIGIFEQVHWKTFDDSLGSQPLDMRAFIPLPGVNSALIGLNDQEDNVLLGANLTWYPRRWIKLYAQYLTDNSQLAIDGYQLGFLLSGIGKRFDVGMELNQVERATGLTPDALQSHYHFNQPMSHPQGNGFTEWVGRLTYYHNRIFARVKVISAILEGWEEEHPLVDAAQERYRSSDLLFADVQVAYVFNPFSNLEIYSGITFREEKFTEAVLKNQFWYLGVRTRFNRGYRDF